MKLPHYDDIARGHMLEAVNQIPPIEQDVHVLWYEDVGEAVVAIALGDEWGLLLEVSSYEPTGEPVEIDEDAPFYTEGTMWAIDLRTGQVRGCVLEAEEGDIQGVVYATGALQYGGRIAPIGYVDYLKRTYGEIMDRYSPRDEESANELVPPNHDIIDLLAKAGLVHLVETKVTTGFGYEPAQNDV